MANVANTIYLNGTWLTADDAHISVDERGFTFADGIYEGLLYANGELFESQAHFTRLQHSARTCRLSLPFDQAQLDNIMHELLAANDLVNTTAFIYLQVTRGTAPRNHPFPPQDTPVTVYAFARALAYKPEWNTGISVHLAPETRGSLCFVKSIALLPNILARQAAIDHGAAEAIFVRDTGQNEGILSEGTHSNFCALIDGVLHTHPANEYILNGITRQWLLAACEHLNIEVTETPVALSRLSDIQEAFICGTTTMVTPITHINISEQLLQRYPFLNLSYPLDIQHATTTRQLQAALFSASGIADR